MHHRIEKICEFKIGIKNWIPLIEFWKSGSSPDISRCDSLGCCVPFLGGFEMGTGRLEAAIVQPHFVLVGAILCGVETICSLFSMAGKCWLYIPVFYS